MQTYQKSRWDLSELLPSDSDIQKVFIEIEGCVNQIESKRNTLTADMDGGAFCEILTLTETLSALAGKITAYSVLRFSEDTQDAAALAVMGNVENFLMDMQNRILFFSLWWKSLTDEESERLLSYAGNLKYYLERLRQFKEHILSEPEEKIINIKDANGSGALLTIYDMLTSKYDFVMDVDGKTTHNTRDGLMVYVRDIRPDVRESAYKELFRVFGNDTAVLSQMYAYRVRDWAKEQIELRKFKSPINVRNKSNDIPDDVVDTLLSVCKEDSYVFHDYFKLKAKWLNLPKLRRFDLYAPIKAETKKKIDYPDAVSMVLESFTEFSPEFGKLAAEVFDKKHIDADDRTGKRGGAFCYGVHPKLTPWVLVNYTGEPRQVATLAHELGHAVHSLLAQNHSVLTFHAPLPLAETASVFSEMLLTERLLEEEKDADARRLILSSAIDDMYATVLRQAFFVLFEKTAHTMIEENAPVNELNRIYMELLREQFGDSVDVSDDFQIEWITIPHIYHTPFYCYAYSFGELLSLSLYKRYKEEGKNFIPKIIKILSHGGSASPDVILKEVSIDMRDAQFWHGGFDFIKEMIDKALG
ncbi:M3 family oligoendopeptidase [Candidatus Magnetomonas plexicatena]|uniref:M3 family oligoendopeptidase n=1 Tax=Candidatus Magnetomonas plexicatena TaxID=2552947 RepID=UPI001C76605E|nr:M3 family oligoendopeptidase [Nitrospirales bacterium LBB_01]